jgi:hypothetical protein
MESTTVKVSKDTVRQLAALQRGLHTRTLEETIHLLLKRHRKELLDEAFGADRRRVSSFSEGDRGEDRS